MAPPGQKAGAAAGAAASAGASEERARTEQVELLDLCCLLLTVGGDVERMRSCAADVEHGVRVGRTANGMAGGWSSRSGARELGGRGWLRDGLEQEVGPGCVERRPVS